MADNRIDYTFTTAAAEALWDLSAGRLVACDDCTLVMRDTEAIETASGTWCEACRLAEGS
jgi:hypothetical protein